MQIPAALRAAGHQVLAWTSNAEKLVARLEVETRPPVPIREALQAIESRKHALARSLRSEAIALKILNVLLCRHHMLSRSDAVLSRPIGLILDPIKACQMFCPGCVHSRAAKGLFDWNPGRMSMDTATALFHRYGPYAMEASFCNYGEPTLNPDTPRMIRLAKEYRLYTTMSSNLAHPRFRAEDWVGCGLDFLIVSIDGVTPGVYDIFRRNGDHDLAFANLRELVEAKRSRGFHTPVVHWQFLAFEHNKHEIPAAIDLARDIGVNQLSIGTPFDVSWDDPSIRPAEGVEPSLHKFDLLTERWLAENERPFPLKSARIHEAFEAGFGDLPDAAVSADTGHTCSWLYKNMSLDANGGIFPCCCAPRPDADLMFGMFDAEPDPFNAPKHRLARQHFAGAAVDGPFCTTCEWQQDTAQIDRNEMRHYLRGVGAFSGDLIERLISF